MGKGRLEAFSDGVIAVIITIMVLDLKAPLDARWSSLTGLTPSLAIYALSFLTVGIFWVNHHHLLHGAVRADGRLLWANLLLLFVLSLVPFVTAYVAGQRGAPLPLAVYALLMALASASFTVCTWVVSGQRTAGDPLEPRFRNFFVKGVVVATLYLLAIPLAFLATPAAYAIFVLIPLSYAWPERKFAEAA
jgi:uncharacterized membrane protein